MALAGTFENLDEARKLTQDVLMSGTLDFIIEYGGLASMLPGSLLKGTSHIYNVEKEWDVAGAATFFQPGDQLVNVSDVEYDQIQFGVKQVYRSQRLDNFIASNWNNYNDFERTSYVALVRRFSRFLDYMSIYGNSQRNPLEMDGLHAQIYKNPVVRGTDGGASAGLNIRVNGPLSIEHLREAEDAVEMGNSGVTPFWYTPRKIRTRINQGLQEVGLAEGRTGTFDRLTDVVIGSNQIGQAVPGFNGTPFVLSNVLKAEKNNTGTSVSDPRLPIAETHADARYSMFLIAPGLVGSDMGGGGVQYVYGERNVKGQGNEGGAPFPIYHDAHDNLESFDASQQRLISYPNIIHDHPRTLVRLYDITNAPIKNVK